MPIELKQGSLPALDKSLVANLETSTWDNFKTGWSVGLKNTTLSLLKDITIAKKAKREYESTGESAIPEEEWVPGNDIYVPGVEWEPHITYELADRMREAYVANKKFAQTEHAMKWVAALGGGIMDPINLIPLGVGAGGKILSSMAKVGSANAMLELAITPIVKRGYEARGDEFTGKDIAMNLGIAFAAGGVLTGGARGLGQLIKKMRASNLNEVTAVDRRIEQGIKYNPEFTIEQNLSELINGQVLRTSDLMPKAQGQDFIGNKRFDTPEADIFVDSYGTVYRTADEANTDTIRIGFNKKNNIVIAGGPGLIAKLSNRLLQVLPENKIEIKVGNEVTRFNSKKDFSNWAAEEKRFYSGKDNWSDDIDLVFVAERSDGSIKIIIDPKTNKKTAYRTLNKKQLKKDRDITELPDDDELASIGLRLEGSRVVDDGDIIIRTNYPTPAARQEALARKRAILNNFEDVSVQQKLTDAEYKSIVKHLQTKNIKNMNLEPSTRNVDADDDARIKNEDEKATTKFDQTHKNNGPVDAELKTLAPIVQETARNPDTYVYGRVKDLDQDWPRYGFELDDVNQKVIIKDAPSNLTPVQLKMRQVLIDHIEKAKKEYTRVEGEKAMVRCATKKGLVE